MNGRSYHKFNQQNSYLCGETIVVYYVLFRPKRTENLIPICKPVRDNPPIPSRVKFQGVSVCFSRFGEFRSVSAGMCISVGLLFWFFFILFFSLLSFFSALSSSSFFFFPFSAQLSLCLCTFSLPFFFFCLFGSSVVTCHSFFFLLLLSSFFFFFFFLPSSFFFLPSSLSVPLVDYPKNCYNFTACNEKPKQLSINFYLYGHLMLPLFKWAAKF